MIHNILYSAKVVTVTNVAELILLQSYTFSDEFEIKGIKNPPIVANRRN